MNPKTCRTTRREIDESDLNVAFSEQTTAHLLTCSDCRQFRDERGRLRALVGSLTPVTAPADFEYRLRARIATERERPTRASLFPQFLFSTPVMAAAGLLVVFAASIVWLTQRNTAPAPSVASRPAESTAPTSDRPTVEESNTAAVVNEQTNTKGTEAVVNPNISQRVAPRGVNDQLLAKSKVTSGDMLARPAAAIKQNTDAPGEVSLIAPDKPLMVSVEDAQGTKHKILLPPVSFGAQKLVDSRISVSTSNTKSW